MKAPGLRQVCPTCASTMRTILVGIVIFLEGAMCMSEYNFTGVIRHLAVGDEKVFVATDSELHQFQHDLEWEKVKDLNSGQQSALSILLPFEANGTLIICGISDCGFCEILDVTDITRTLYRENFLPLASHDNESHVAFLIDYTGDPNGTYILLGRENAKTRTCLVVDPGVTFRNTLYTQPSDIFSKSDSNPIEVYIQIPNVQWVDGFQVSSHLQTYLFGNLLLDTGNKVFLLRMNNHQQKEAITRSLKAAYLHCCPDQVRPTLVSSTFILSGSSVLWMGIFTASHPDHPENTALAIYSITDSTPQNPSEDFTCFPSCEPKGKSPVVKPLAVLFKHSSMTSVTAQRKGDWIVLFIGTSNGQLIKLLLDTDYRSGCAKVLYRSDDDRAVFPKMYFDPKDNNYIYIGLTNQIKRVAVTQCDIHDTLKKCVSSKDPFCGWCGVTNRCSKQEDCPGSYWISISKDFFKKELISVQVVYTSAKQINLTVQLHLDAKEKLPITCVFKVEAQVLCKSSVAHLPNCSCSFPGDHLSSGFPVTVTANISSQIITKSLILRSCTHISENMPSDAQCIACVSAGCYWDSSSRNCTWIQVSAPHGQDTCNDTSSERSYMPEILSLWPNKVSFHGKNNAEIRGNNLELVQKIRFQGFMDCTSRETPVLKHLNGTLKFNIPGGNKETVRVCLVTAAGQCYSNATLTYSSQPTCTNLQPRVTWSSGGRKIQVMGSNLEFVDSVHIQTSSKELNSSDKIFWFHTDKESKFKGSELVFTVSLLVGTSTVVCAKTLSCHSDPEFISFSYSKSDSDVLVNIQKKEDKLYLTADDLKVWGFSGKEKFQCMIQNIKSRAVICTIKGKSDIKLDSLMIRFGSTTSVIQSGISYTYPLVALIILVFLGAVAGVFIQRKTQQRRNEQMNEHLEMLENEIRNEIRQGFVDLQTQSSDLVENVGTIPYLDYKHFALKIFFPEGVPLANQMIKEIGQDAVRAEMDEKCQVFAALIRDQTFLTCFVHTLEQQRSFTLKDKCTVASLLTIALHRDLPYLTQSMEELLQSLMDQPNNTQLKLLLRRTESIVEKLLTNWMSICLYGFLRESVGQHLFLLVSALMQQISKGPVDAVTEKALYTLNEDWLLCQAQGFNFSQLKLKVLFAVGTEGEVSEPLEVSVLTCDTIDQVKDKILQTFQSKFGFRYTQQLRNIGIEYLKEGSYVSLEEIDESSKVQGDVTMLNTLNHYEIPDGASIKVITKKLHAPLSPQTSLKDDQNFTTKYFHLIDPDIDTDLSEHPERKKLKLKEIYLTKLLSTKVAVHSFVETLFRSIWGMPNNRAPLAIKYFFDFLDAQAEKKKILDPDILHIWKTNSLPLRFWVNILKNPNFVFGDLEKTPHLDSCLSVIAQAFMDSFSLTDHQLGKNAPTNKLLYAKDIPLYKQEVKTYYNLVRDQPSVKSQDFKVFLQEESKKHENEFNEAAALRELYKYLEHYFTETEQQLEQNNASCWVKEEMHRVKELFESVKRSAWI